MNRFGFKVVKDIDCESLEYIDFYVGGMEKQMIAVVMFESGRLVEQYCDRAIPIRVIDEEADNMVCDVVFYNLTWDKLEEFAYEFEIHLR